MLAGLPAGGRSPTTIRPTRASVPSTPSCSPTQVRNGATTPPARLHARLRDLVCATSTYLGLRLTRSMLTALAVPSQGRVCLPAAPGSWTSASPSPPSLSRARRARDQIGRSRRVGPRLQSRPVLSGQNRRYPQACRRNFRTVSLWRVRITPSLVASPRQMHMGRSGTVFALVPSFVIVRQKMIALSLDTSPSYSRMTLLPLLSPDPRRSVNRTRNARATQRLTKIAFMWQRGPRTVSRGKASGGRSH